MSCGGSTRPAADGRVIVAHLGNGASMAAIRGGVGVDTTMGFTPAAGLVMGTRSGDLDPGILTFLARERGLGAEELDELVNKRSGLLGLSGTSSDMSDLLAQEAEDEAAALAVEVFCYRARQFVGALTAALGGLDTLVFTAGIGERAAPVRARICAGLEHLGVELNPSENDRHAAVISAEGSRVTVRVIATDEDRMIARHTAVTIGGQAQPDPGHVRRFTSTFQASMTSPRSTSAADRDRLEAAILDAGAVDYLDFWFITRLAESEMAPGRRKRSAKSPCRRSATFSRRARSGPGKLEPPGEFVPGQTIR